MLLGESRKSFSIPRRVLANATSFIACWRGAAESLMRGARLTRPDAHNLAAFRDSSKISHIIIGPRQSRITATSRVLRLEYVPGVKITR